MCQASELDEGMTSFFQALKNASETEVDSMGGKEKVVTITAKGWNLGGLGLPDGYNWTFLLRECYAQLVTAMGLKETEKTKTRAAIVVGTSGVGKSAFRFYIMRRWLSGDEALPMERFAKVIFNLGDRFYEMDPKGNVLLLPSVDSLGRFPKDRLALLDPCQQIAGLDKILHFEFMLVTTSASPLSGQETKFGNYNELMKVLLDPKKGSVQVMPLWSYQEIKVVAPKAKDELIRNFGGVPRWCLREDLNTEQKMEEALGEIVKNDQLGPLCEFLQSGADSDELIQDRRLPYKVMKIESKGRTWGARSFMSKFVAGFVIKKAQRFIKQKQADIASMMRNPFSMQGFGHIFEEWAYKQLVSGDICVLSDKLEMKGKFERSRRWYLEL